MLLLLLGGMWTTLSELSGQVAIAIMKAKQESQRPGWVRNLGFDPENVTQEINVLRDRIIQLERENQELRQKQELDLNTHSDRSGEVDLAQYKMTLHFTEIQMIITSNLPAPEEIDISTTLEDIF